MREDKNKIYKRNKITDKKKDKKQQERERTVGERIGRMKNLERSSEELIKNSLLKASLYDFTAAEQRELNPLWDKHAIKNKIPIFK